MAERVRDLAKGLKFNASSLAEEAGIKKSAMGNYWSGKRPYPTESLPRLAATLRTSVDRLLGVRGPSPVMDAAAADWVIIKEFDIRELTEEARGPVVSETPFRKDWLNRTFGHDDLWLAKLPADYESLGVYEGELVFVQDVAPGEAKDGALYIFRVHGRLTVARVDVLGRYQSDRAGERRVNYREMGGIDDQIVPIARVLGMPLRRI